MRWALGLCVYMFETIDLSYKIKKPPVFQPRRLLCFTLKGKLLHILKFAIKTTKHSNLVVYGEPSETRTPDTLIKSQVLCRLS